MRPSLAVETRDRRPADGNFRLSSLTVYYICIIDLSIEDLYVIQFSSEV